MKTFASFDTFSLLTINPFLNPYGNFFLSCFSNALHSIHPSTLVIFWTFLHTSFLAQDVVPLCLHLSKFYPSSRTISCHLLHKAASNFRLCSLFQCLKVFKICFTVRLNCAKWVTMTSMWISSLQLVLLKDKSQWSTWDKILIFLPFEKNLSLCYSDVFYKFGWYFSNFLQSVYKTRQKSGIQLCG